MSWDGLPASSPSVNWQSAGVSGAPTGAPASPTGSPFKDALLVLAVVGGLVVLMRVIHRVNMALD